MTIHCDYENNGTTEMCHTKYTGIDFSQDYHIFTLIWEKNKIQWLVDGIVKRTDYRYYTILGQPVECTINAWQQYLLNTVFPTNPMAIIFNLAIQNGIDAPDNLTVFPSHMEIDWIRYYQRKPCQNAIITNANQHPLNNNSYNVIFGQSVIIDCNYSILSNQQLNIIASESIVLKPGFSAFSGSVFQAKINSSNCNFSKSFDDINSFQDTANQVISEIQSHNMILSSDNIKVYPNPSNGSINIEFPNPNYESFNILISTIYGKIIESITEIESPLTTIDLSKNPKGIYILSLINNKDLSITTHKLIIQ